MTGQMWVAEREDVRWVLPDGTEASDGQADGIALGAIPGRAERVVTRLATWGPCSRRLAVTLFRRWYVEHPQYNGADLRQL